jgi:hypothetical protein
MVSIRRRLCGTATALGGLLVVLGAPLVVSGQTDYYNTDRGRPVQIEDAYPVERHAFELQLAPLRLERASGGIYSWGIEPELAYGLLPRTQFEIGFPYTINDASRSGSSGLAGVEIGLLHNLNVETRSLPALGVGMDLLLPVGGHAPDEALGTVRGLLTRTFSFARFHVNGDYTFGGSSGTGGLRGLEVSRWLAGMAVDHTLPLRSLLMIGDVYARQPIDQAHDLEWNVSAGVRYQLSPRYALDAGLGRKLTGDDRGWFITFGTAYAFAIRSLIPGADR